jgi:hypothetical protein
MHPRDGKGIFNDQVGSCQSFGDVAARPDVANKGIRRPLQGPGQPGVAIHIGMNDGSAFLQGSHRIEHSGQLFVTNVDEIKRRFGLFERIGRHRRHPLPDEADTLLGQHADVAVAASV